MICVLEQENLNYWWTNKKSVRRIVNMSYSTKYYLFAVCSWLAVAVNFLRLASSLLACDCCFCRWQMDDADLVTATQNSRSCGGRRQKDLYGWLFFEFLSAHSRTDGRGKLHSKQRCALFSKKWPLDPRAIYCGPYKKMKMPMHGLKFEAS